MTGAAPIQVETLPANSSQARLNWSIARLLREQHPDLRLRAQVRNHWLLEQVTLGSLLDDPLRLDAFLEEFRSLPQCGSTQVTRLRKVLVSALRTAGSTGPCALRRPQPGAMPADAPAKTVSVQPQPTECRFLPDFVDAADDVFFRMWRLAQFDPFVYLPTTLPEFAKTPQLDFAHYAAKHNASAMRTMRSGGIFWCSRSGGECWKMSPTQRAVRTAPMASEKVRQVLRYQAAA